jgi:hypothetical protein
VRELICDLRFFAGFKRVSPGYLGDPCGCPRQMGCDDALEVEEFVVVGDCIDDMSGCQ